MRAYHQKQNQPERVLQLNEEADKLDLTKVETNEETIEIASLISYLIILNFKAL